MKTCESPTRIGLLVLIMMGLLCTELMAQPRTATGQAAAQDTISTDHEVLLIEMLNVSFKSLADEDRRGRQVGGSVLLGLGIGSGLAGGTILILGEGDDARIVGYSLLGGGALLSGLSLLPFKVRSESERIYAEFSRMPADTQEQVHQKYFYWNRRFEELAQKMRKGRIVGGITSIIVGGVTGLVVLNGSGQDSAVIWSVMGPVLGGVSSLLIKSNAERRYETYRRAKEDILGYTSNTEIQFGIAPLPGGGILGVMQVRF